MTSRSLWPLTTVAIAMVVIDALWLPVFFAAGWGFPATYQQNIAPVATYVDLAQTLFRFATIIVFAGWIYVAGRNLRDSGYDNLEFTPAARIWWFAVPFANLVMPYRGMRELWNASRGTDPFDASSPLLVIWWASWLLSSIGGRIAAALPDAPEPLAGLIAVTLARAVCTIIILRGIAMAQDDLVDTHLVETFA